MTEVTTKVCKVYPRNGLQYISDILPNRGRIELPAKIEMNSAEVRRCMSFADVYEVIKKGDVLLTIENYLEDNADATVATDVPKDKLVDYTESEDGDGDDTPTKPATPVGLQWAGNDTLPHYFSWGVGAANTTYNFYINDTKVAENIATQCYNASSADQFKTAGTYNVSITAVVSGVESDKCTISYTVTAPVTVDDNPDTNESDVPPTPEEDPTQQVNEDPETPANDETVYG